MYAIRSYYAPYITFEPDYEVVTEAETAYRRAHALGWDPQPGWAALQAERGDFEAAIRGVITSYSIHYTKLYDPPATHCACSTTADLARGVRTRRALD